MLLSLKMILANLADCNCLFVSPVNCISRALMHMSMCCVYGVLVLPLWRSASFWPLLCMGDGYFIHSITVVTDLPTEKTSFVPYKSGKGICGNTDLKFRMLAVQKDFRFLKVINVRHVCAVMFRQMQIHSRE